MASVGNGCMNKPYEKTVSFIMKAQSHLPRVCGGTCDKFRVVISDFSERGEN